MAGSTITGTVTVGVTLTAADNPLTVEVGAAVDAPTDRSAIYVYGPASNWTIDNNGLIEAQSGISLDAAATIDNAAGATITGEAYGIGLAGQGTSMVTNLGGILGTGPEGAGVLAAYSATIINGSTADVTALITGARFGIDVAAQGGVGSVTNYGTVSSTGDTLTGIGAVYIGYGSLLNGSNDDHTALIITSSRNAVAMGGANAVVANYGTIESVSPEQSRAGNNCGIYLSNPGQITNGSATDIHALVEGHVGIYETAFAYLGNTTITNFGSIVGFGTGNTPVACGIYLDGLGSSTIVNGSDTDTMASIIGYRAGIAAAGGSDITNYGTIASTAGVSGIAIQFASDLANRLIVEPGAVFFGVVLGGQSLATSESTLELAAGTGAIGGLGTQFQDFVAMQVDSGGTWDLTGGTNQIAVLTGGGTLSLGSGVLAIGDASAFTGVITLGDALVSFASGAPTATLDVSAGSSIDLAGVAWTDPTPIYDAADGTLAVGGATLQVERDLTGLRFLAQQDSSNGTLVTVDSAPCFVAGTRVTTARGDVAVEDLAIGDSVRTVFAGTASVIWIGHHRVDCARHPCPWDVWPVRITSGAFGNGAPRCDLLLSPDHAVFVDGTLIPVRYLLNGATIAQEQADNVTYFHVELAAHDVLIAEGLSCESYLDTGNRASFANGGVAVRMHADFALDVWRGRACAGLVREGAELAAIRCRLLERATQLGHRLTQDADLHLLVDGQPFHAGAVEGARHRFDVRRIAREVRIVSNSAVPAQTSMSGSDHRRLGVMIHRVACLRPWQWQIIAAADIVGSGFHELEEGHGRSWRWTNGDAALRLPPECLRGGLLALELDVVAANFAWRAPARVADRTVPLEAGMTACSRHAGERV